MFITKHRCDRFDEFLYTQRSQSRVQHVRDREADTEAAKNWLLVHLRCSKGEGRRAEPTFGLCFCAKAPKETNGKARRAEPMLWLW